MGRLAQSARVKNAAAWALSLALLFAAASQTQAQTTKKFDGGGSPAGYAWATIANWDPDGVPAYPDDIVMDNTLQNPILPRNSISTSIYVRSIEFVDGFALNNLWTLGNRGSGDNYLTVQPDDPGQHLIKVGCTSGRVRFQETISRPYKLGLVVGASGTLDVAAGGTLELDLEVSGGTGVDITKTGEGTLVLSGANTYSGNTTNSAGKIRLYGGTTTVTLENSGFETPVQVAPLYTYVPTDASWTFVGGSGIFTNGSPWSSESTTEGGQAAFLQGNGSSISQGFTTASAGYYVVRLRAFGRTGLLGPKGLDLKIDGNVVQSFTPPQYWITHFSPVFYLTAGSHTVGFYTKSDPDPQPDWSSFVDAVQIVGPLEAGGDVIPDGAGKGDVTINGTLDVNALSETLNGLSGSGTVDTEAGGTPTLTVGNNDASSTFSGVLKNTAGTLGLAKTGAGTLTLSGPNTYSGDTTVSAGTLALSSSGSIASSANIIVGTAPDSGAKLDVTAAGITIGASQTLKGCGTVDGTVTVNGALAPGASIGELTLEDPPVLGGTTAMEVSKATGPVYTSDKLVVKTGGGTLAYGGTLNITVAAGSEPLAVGDTFDLFDADAFSGSFTRITGMAGPGLGWDTSKLAVDGTVKVNAAVAAGTILSIENLGGGSYKLRLQGSVGGAYHLVKASDITTTPMSSWTTVTGSGTNAPSPGGIWEYTVTETAPRFYRLSTGPE